MGVPVNGRETRLALIQESTFNTIPGSPVGELIYLRGDTVRGSTARVVDPTMAGNLRGQLASVRSERNVAGNIPITVNAQSMCALLRNLIGTPTQRRPAQNATSATTRLTGTTISGVEILGCNIATPVGTGTLVWTITGTTLAWTAPSGTAGTAINVGAGGYFTLPGSAANTELYVRVSATPADRPLSNTTDNAITVYNAFEYRVTVGADLPTGMILERDRGTKIGGTSRYHRRTGCRVGSASFNLGATGIAEGDFSITGADFSDSATALDATLDDFGHSGFSNLEGTVVVNRAAALGTYQQFQTSWNNNLDTSGRTIGGGGILGHLEAGLAEVSGSLQALFDSAQLLTWAAADTPVALQHQLRKGHGGGTAGNELVVIDIPRALLSEDTEQVNGPQGTTLTANWSAYRTAGSEIDAAFIVRTSRATV
jgi:hypothetical protein